MDDEIKGKVMDLIHDIKKEEYLKGASERFVLGTDEKEWLKILTERNPKRIEALLNDMVELDKFRTLASWAYGDLDEAQIGFGIRSINSEVDMDELFDEMSNY